MTTDPQATGTAGPRARPTPAGDKERPGSTPGRYGPPGPGRSRDTRRAIPPGCSTGPPNHPAAKTRERFLIVRFTGVSSKDSPGKTSPIEGRISPDPDQARGTPWGVGPGSASRLTGRSRRAYDSRPGPGETPAARGRQSGAMAGAIGLNITILEGLSWPKLGVLPYEGEKIRTGWAPP